MIQFNNEQQYYTTPMYPHSKRADLNLAYKVITHMPPDFTATNLQHKIRELYEVTLSLQFLGHALREFTEKCYVTNDKRLKKTWQQNYYKQSYYNITDEYRRVFCTC